MKLMGHYRIRNSKRGSTLVEARGFRGNSSKAFGIITNRNSQTAPSHEQIPRSIIIHLFAKISSAWGAQICIALIHWYSYHTFLVFIRFSNYLHAFIPITFANTAKMFLLVFWFITVMFSVVCWLFFYVVCLQWRTYRFISRLEQAWVWETTIAVKMVTIRACWRKFMLKALKDIRIVL